MKLKEFKTWDKLRKNVETVQGHEVKDHKYKNDITLLAFRKNDEWFIVERLTGWYFTWGHKTLKEAVNAVNNCRFNHDQLFRMVYQELLQYGCLN